MLIGESITLKKILLVHRVHRKCLVEKLTGFFCWRPLMNGIPSEHEDDTIFWVCCQLSCTALNGSTFQFIYPVFNQLRPLSSCVSNLSKNLFPVNVCDLKGFLPPFSAALYFPKIPNWLLAFS